MTGIITAIKTEKKFGFIKCDGSPDVFFHVSDLNDLEFDDRLVERRVTFDVVDATKGPRARNVRAAT